MGITHFVIVLYGYYPCVSIYFYVFWINVGSMSVLDMLFLLLIAYNLLNDAANEVVVDMWYHSPVK